ncbi:ABC transporter permease [Salimicrobium flavidum]|uniref:Putative hemin transport system permease protein HrtB n=1 Tax=Salimicrobium flavidum TaxID=570947 RepID=A0A1N7JAA7_9BACI|nr:ABC transporter permease [Salimicrobium flavidum]SIS46207.1 putative ABC transport system permease protein [Salimicrobium flavidum]
MNMALKEMKKNKTRFLIIGAVVFLISLLVFLLSGLSNGLSEDNMASIRNLPDGTFHMSEEAEGSYTQSLIEEETIQENTEDESFAFSVQMGALETGTQKHSLAFFTTTAPSHFPDVQEGHVFVDQSLKQEGVTAGEDLEHPQSGRSLVVSGFVDNERFSHAPVAFTNAEDFRTMFRMDQKQVLYTSKNVDIKGLDAFSKKEFLASIPSYQAEQMTLSMILWFLVLISGMLFAIFFYMMNVQKTGMFGILKAIGFHTRDLFIMMWTQMLMITFLSVLLSVIISQVASFLLPETMPYDLPLETTLWLAGLFFAVGFLGSTLSGLHIRQIKPLEAIQQGEG